MHSKKTIVLFKRLNDLRSGLNEGFTVNKKDAKLEQ